VNKAEIFFILVEPKYKGNIGAAARVMNNFGFSNLRITGTIPSKEDHYIAVHSEEVMDSIEIFPDLRTALNDIDNVIAVTRRSGKKKSIDINVNQAKDFITKLPRGKTSFVFGRETYGLTDEEASLCPIRCIIPAHEDFSSLNLAQAVAVVAYELFSNDVEDKSDVNSLAGVKEISEGCKSIIDNLRNIGYFHSGDVAVTEKRLENLLMKSYTSMENLNFLIKLFQRIEVVNSKHQL